MRKRNYFLVGGSILVLLFSYFSDPNGGALTAAWLGNLVMPVVAVWFSYLTRVALFDYLDMEELYLKARSSAVGAGLTFIGVCIVVFGLLGLFGSSARAADVTTFIPTKAYVHLPVVRQELSRIWPDHPKDI
jgi:hypothetical protein